MQRLVPIPCKTCEEIFLPKSPRNIFCCRLCFKKDFYSRLKEEGIKKYPTFICPRCNHRIELDFDPARKGSNKWLEFKCPDCNVLMISVSENISTKDVPL